MTSKAAPRANEPSRGRGKLPGALLVAALFTLSPRASAAPDGLTLTWTAPPGCPQEADVALAIEQLVGERDAKLARPLRAEAAIVEKDGRFVLELSWQTERDRAVRTLEGETCAELGQAAAVVIALAADPRAQPDAAAGGAPGVETGVAEPPPIATKPLVTPPRSAPPPPPPRPAPEPEDETALRGSVRAAMALDVGSLPRASPGGLLGAGLALPPAALELDVLSFVPVEKEVLEGAGLFWLSALSLRPCWLVSGPRFGMVPCVAAEAHVIRGSGRKLETSDERWAWYFRFGPSVEGTYRVSSSLSLRFGGALLVAPSRPTFVIQEAPVHEPSAVTGRIVLGFELLP